MMYFANLNFLKRDSVRPDGCNSLTLEQATLSHLVERKSEILLRWYEVFRQFKFSQKW